MTKHDGAAVRKGTGDDDVYGEGALLPEGGGRIYGGAGQDGVFPEGGGQGADRGTLGSANVLDAHIHEDVVTHLTDAPLTEGQTVTGQVDANRRLSMSQQHTGEHIFSCISSSATTMWGSTSAAMPSPWILTAP